MASDNEDNESDDEGTSSSRSSGDDKSASSGPSQSIDSFEADLFASFDEKGEDANRKPSEPQTNGSGGGLKRPRNEIEPDDLADKLPEQPSDDGCPHDTVWHGICADCGKEIAEDTNDGGDEKPNEPRRVAFSYLGGVTVTQGKAEALRAQAQADTESQGRLHLVLDLDHTLLNSARMRDVDPEEGPKLHNRMLQQQHDAEEGTTANADSDPPTLHCLSHIGMWTKLRPFVFEFLLEASKLYDMHVYTMGSRHYAEEMVRLIDPQNTLFKGRIISAQDSTV
jgi:RNA polymerase II C-terminal domain phosphatase-like 3/4